MSNLPWLKVTFLEKECHEPITFHIQSTGVSKVTCIRCAQNMFVGPQPFKAMKCTACGIHFLTPLHSSYTCETYKPTVTEDFKFEKPLDIGAFLHSHGKTFEATFSKIGFVYYKDKSTASSLIQRPSRKLRNDLKFLNHGWVKALTVLTNTTLRFYDLPSESSFERYPKFLGQVQLDEVQVGTMSEYKGRRFIIVLSKGSSSVLIQTGSEVLQSWWKDSIVKNFSGNHDSFDRTVVSEKQFLRSKAVWNRSLRHAHLLTKLHKNVKMDPVLFDNVIFRENNPSFLSLKSQESLHIYPEFTTTFDIENSSSDEMESAHDSSFSSDGEELSTEGSDTRSSEEYNEINSTLSFNFKSDLPLTWEALIDSFPLPPVR